MSIIIELEKIRINSIYLQEIQKVLIYISSHLFFTSRVILELHRSRLYCYYVVSRSVEILCEVKFMSEWSHESEKRKRLAVTRAHRNKRISVYTIRYIGSWFSVPKSRDASCTTYRWRRKTNGLRASRWLRPKSVRDLARPTRLRTRLTFSVEKGRWVALRREERTHVPKTLNSIFDLLPRELFGRF